MTAIMKRLVLFCSLWAPLTAQAQSLPTASSAVSAMNLANQYFQAQFPNPGLPVTTGATVRPSNYWFRAVYFEGLMDFYGINPQPGFLSYAVTWGSGNKWSLVGGNSDRNANDQCAGQTYIDLYQLTPSPDYLKNIEADINGILASSAPVTDWWWIDAVHMAMPVYAKLGVLTGNTAYFNEMYRLYADTRNIQGKAGLFNPRDGLWWRDSTFVNPPLVEPNGKSCYWSRGNGWVYSALVRVLDVLPTSDPHYAQYLSDFKAMSQALLAVQLPNGFWGQSLFDSTDFPGPETSGTALFTYGLAWGVRKGILPAATYEPAAAKAWNAMVADALHPNGFLGYVQDTGDQPVTGVTFNSVPAFQDIGIGCFLLAGSEVVKLVDSITATPTATAIASQTPTASKTSTETATRTATSTHTPIPPVATLTSTATWTNTLAPLTPTDTSAPPTLTATPVPPSPTRTATAVPPTVTDSTTPIPLATFTATPSASPTKTNSSVPPTATLTNIPAPPTLTRTPVPTASATTPLSPTFTRTSMPPTATVTRTATAVAPTATYTPLPPTATFTPASTGAGNLALYFQTGVTGDTINSPHPQIEVVNTGTGSLSLNNVEARYWFNCDCTGQSLQTFVDWAGLIPLGSTVTGDIEASVQATTLGGQTNYVSYKFTGNLVLQPGQMIEIQGRFNKSDYSNMLQDNDWSYTPAISFIPWTKITGYQNGSLVWGQEPVTTAALKTASVVAFPNPSMGSGVNLSVNLTGSGTEAKDVGSPTAVDPNALISFKAYTLDGQLVWLKTVTESSLESSNKHSLYWNERNLENQALASGLYIVTVTVKSGIQSRSSTMKIAILR
jgi:unsaturated rhamnogalacturonyl hydrolase